VNSELGTWNPEPVKGLSLFRCFLPLPAQQQLWAQCDTLAHGAVPMYTPTVRGGRPMSVGMLWLGRHWNALTYGYEPTRSDFDQAPAPPIPASFRELAARAAEQAGFTFAPDICIVNYYNETSRMGVHQDKDESRESLEAGVPIVSVSLGDTARFVVGGLTRREDEVIGYVRRGFANKQIGDALAIREDTVKKHLRSAYLKLGVHRRAQVITSAAQQLLTG